MILEKERETSDRFLLSGPGAFTEVMPGMHKEESCYAGPVSVKPGQSLKVSGNHVDGFVITMISEWEEA